MFVDPALPGRAGWRRALLCLLLLVLLLHGQLAVVQRLLGTAHWHAAAGAPGQAMLDPRSVLAEATQRPAAPGPASWLQAARTWRQQLQARSPLTGGHAEPGHQHGDSARHHHGAADASVVVLEPQADSSDKRADGAATSPLQLLALAHQLALPGLAQATPHWPQAAAPGWRNASLRLPERPPRG